MGNNTESRVLCSGADDVGVFYARDMETLEEGPNAEKDKTVGRAKDGPAGVP
jgi:hypothetical protein